jgi:hypothetical protein
MKKSVVLFSAIALLSSVVAFAGPPKDGGKPAKGKTAPKIVDVWTCPIQGGVVKDHKDKGVLVANKYRAHFCCGGCEPEFAKLTEKEKIAKLEKLAKTEADAAKKGKG